MIKIVLLEVCPNRQRNLVQQQINNENVRLIDQFN